MYFELTHNILINGQPINYINNVVINKSWRNMTDTCTILFAKNVRVNSVLLQRFIKVGDKVEVYLGYDGNNRLEFSGYVARSPKPTIPLQVECEDEMWKLKRTSLTRTFVNKKLSKIIEEIAPGYEYLIFDFTVPKLRLNGATPAQALAKIEDLFGFKSFFRGQKLICGRPYSENLPNVAYHLQRNVIDNSLEYIFKDDIKLKVRATSIFPNNTKLEVELGDPEGEQRTLTYFNKQKTELIALAETDIERLKRDGYKGPITTFGIPYIEHGYRAQIVDNEYEERKSINFVDQVTINYGEGGFRRTVEIGEVAA